MFPPYYFVNILIMKKYLEQNSSEIVDHLPGEILSATKFMQDKGAPENAKLSSSHSRRSPLVQGRLEIRLRLAFTAWKVSKYGGTSGPYFPILGLNTGNTDQK